MWRYDTDDRATLIGSIAGDVFLVAFAVFMLVGIFWW
jgi:hypothetical protein